MNQEEKLQAYETMHRNIQSEYDRITGQMAELKAAGKEKTVTFRSLFAQKVMYKEMLAMYGAYGIKE